MKPGSFYLTNPLTSITLNVGQKGHKEGANVLLLFILITGAHILDTDPQCAAFIYSFA